METQMNDPLRSVQSEDETRQTAAAIVCRTAALVFQEPTSPTARAAVAWSSEWAFAAYTTYRSAET